MKKVSPKKKMMTGGKANPNAPVSRQTIPGSSGVTPGVNKAATVESSAGSTKLKKGGATKTKMMYGGSKVSSMKKMGKKK